VDDEHKLFNLTRILVLLLGHHISRRISGQRFASLYAASFFRRATIQHRPNSTLSPGLHSRLDQVRDPSCSRFTSRASILNESLYRGLLRRGCGLKGVFESGKIVIRVIAIDYRIASSHALLLVGAPRLGSLEPADDQRAAPVPSTLGTSEERREDGFTDASSHSVRVYTCCVFGLENDVERESLEFHLELVLSFDANL